jgi:hypothetical protein
LLGPTNRGTALSVLVHCIPPLSRFARRVGLTGHHRAEVEVLCPVFNPWLPLASRNVVVPLLSRVAAPVVWRFSLWKVVEGCADAAVIMAHPAVL